MIALDPYPIEFLQGNMLTMTALLSVAGTILKGLAVLSKNPSNKVLVFLTGLVESGKAGLANRKRKKNGGGVT